MLYALHVYGLSTVKIGYVLDSERSQFVLQEILNKGMFRAVVRRRDLQTNETGGRGLHNWPQLQSEPRRSTDVLHVLDCFMSKMLAINLCEALQARQQKLLPLSVHSLFPAAAQPTRGTNNEGPQGSSGPLKENILL